MNFLRKYRCVISNGSFVFFLICCLSFCRPGQVQAATQEIRVVSLIKSDGSMQRDVFVPSDEANIKFAQNEFFGEPVSEIKKENTSDGRMKLSRSYTDMEDCVGVIMVQKSLIFSDRIQVRQSIPQYFDENLLKNLSAVYEFTMPTAIVKTLKDRKWQRVAQGNRLVMNVSLDRPGNMDIFFEYWNWTPIIFLVFGCFAICLAAKFAKKQQEFFIPILAVLISFLLSGVAIFIIGESPISALGAMLSGTLGNQTNFLNVLLNATPLIFTGLAVAVAFQCGLFNIGGESQLMVGGFVAAIIGLKIGAPVGVHLILALMGAALAGGFYCSIAGWLKAKFHVHEVISTIMLNYIGYSLLGWLVMIPSIKEEGPNPQTSEILQSCFLPCFTERHGLNYGFILAILTAIFIWFLLYRTSIGFNIRSVGLNEKAAEYSGVNIAFQIVLAMMISGALAGIGGAERVLGIYHKYNNMAFVGYGFDGIAVSLLANNHPLAILLSALLFGFLKAGGSFMNRELGIPVELVVIVQAVIIFFIAADKIVRNIFRMKAEV